MVHFFFIFSPVDSIGNINVKNQVTLRDPLGTHRRGVWLKGGSFRSGSESRRQADGVDLDQKLGIDKH